jgi:protein involved in polysaccharide export with SLBB domain
MKTALVLLWMAAACFAPAATAPAENPPRPGSITVAVTGAVGAPGVVKLEEKKRLLDAIVKAAAFARLADKRHVSVESKSGEVKVYDADRIMKGDDPNPELHDSDIIFVPEK